MWMTFMSTFMSSFIECDKYMIDILVILNILMICHILIHPFVLPCAAVIFRGDCFAWEGGCIFCPRRHQEAATNLPQTRIFHIFTFKRGIGYRSSASNISIHWLL